MSGRTYGSQQPIIAKVWYTGTDTLTTGQWLCFEADTIKDGDGIDQSTDLAVTNANPARTFITEKPNSGNMWTPAGVVHPESSGFTGPGQLTIITGGQAQISCSLNCTVNSTRMTVMMDQYSAGGPGLHGFGSALALQTVDRSSTAGLVDALLDMGPPCGGYAELTPPATGTAATAAEILQINGAAVVKFLAQTIASANWTCAIADGKFDGEKRMYKTETQTTNDIALSFDNHVTSDPEVLFLDAVNEHVYVEWADHHWATIETSAATS